MTDFVGGVNLETPIPETPAETARRAALALASATGADAAGLRTTLYALGLNELEVQW